MKKTLLLILSLAFIATISCSKTSVDEKKDNPQDKTTGAVTPALADKAPEQPAAKNKSMALTPPTLADVGDTSEVAVIETDKGSIVLEFFPDAAPLHVANFKKLARAEFYDGTTFHRVLPGFVIQGGDPNSKDDNPNNDGMGGPGYGVKAEFNDKPHVHGTLSMARSGDPNSAGSQFFICLGRAAQLDEKYTAFGQVIKGLDVVDKIGSIRRDPSNKYDRKLPAEVMRKVRIVKRSEIK